MLMALACTLLRPAGALAQGMALPEFEVKAAYLLNFAKFIEWPPQAFAGKDAPLVLCIVGRDQFGEALDKVDRRSVQSREFRVRRGVSANDMGGCNMVWVSYSEQRRLPQLLQAAGRLPVVTVSDIDDFADAGGTIGLIEVDRRIRFDINLAAAQRAGLRISSQVLRLARSVREAQQ